MQNFFLNCNSNEEVSVLTRTILNIVSNFIPNETVLVNERNPLWITSKSKSAIQVRNLFYKKHLKPNNQETLKHFLKLGIPRRSIMKNPQTLSNYNFNGKCYWAILQHFCAVWDKLEWFIRLQFLCERLSSFNLNGFC